MSVESMSKHISRRILLYILSFCSEKSNAMSAERCISFDCMSARSFGVPLSENSMHALPFFSGCITLCRPVSLIIESMFSPWSLITLAAAAICLAESDRPITVRM